MEDKLIQLKSQENDNVIKVYPYTKAKAITFSNGKTLEEQITNHKHNLASASEDGLISKEDYLKLLNIEPNANKYYHPATHDSNEIIHEGKLLSEILKQESNAKYVSKNNEDADNENINVNSITIGKKFKLMVNELSELEIINIKTNKTLVSLTEDGTFVTKNIKELETT